MPEEIQLRVSPKVASTEALLKREVAFKLKASFDEIRHVEILKRSIDARQSSVKIIFRRSGCERDSIRTQPHVIYSNLLPTELKRKIFVIV